MENSFQKRNTYADAATIVESGCYYAQLKRFIELFDRDNILILDFDDIKNTKKIALKLEDFLKIKFSTSEEKSPVIINKARSYKKTDNYRINKYIPKSYKSFIKNILYGKPKPRNKSIKLLKEFYRKDNLKLLNELNLSFVNKWV